MANLPVCASWFPPAAVAAAASHSARPISRILHVQQLGRRQGPSPAPIWIQVRERDAFRFRSQKQGAGHHPGPEPERDRQRTPSKDILPLGRSTTPLLRSCQAGEGIQPFFQCRIDGPNAREAPDTFCKEKDEISNYTIEIASSCAKVQDLTDIASLDLGTTEFSQDTSNQVVMDILFDAMEHAQSYIFQLINHRRVAISELLHGKICSMASTLEKL
ncbi:hypothetical protein BAE44_0011906 [Dichanthelium oligosanthes]|uniref:Uncharacterized protein n=1 Tax=Dichanthelium oligosanthes TaxID=888268 RepID=A0A1E5VPK5_9POAL|nr:hypothetical protein BAE44_0011906 [Dichanthelium oligosanthes]